MHAKKPRFLGAGQSSEEREELTRSSFSRRISASRDSGSRFIRFPDFCPPICTGRVPAWSCKKTIEENSRPRGEKIAILSKWLTRNRISGRYLCSDIAPLGA